MNLKEQSQYIAMQNTIDYLRKENCELKKSNCVLLDRYKKYKASNEMLKDILKSNNLL